MPAILQDCRKSATSQKIHRTPKKLCLRECVWGGREYVSSPYEGGGVFDNVFNFIPENVQAILILQVSQKPEG